MSVALCTFVGGCIVEEHHHAPPPGPTRIELDETTNIGACGDPSSFSWTVTARETGESATAGCSQPILFDDVTPNAVYTFDVVGYLGSRVCWQGACQVSTPYGVTTIADCSAQIDHLCGL